MFAHHLSTVWKTEKVFLNTLFQKLSLYSFREEWIDRMKKESLLFEIIPHAKPEVT